MDLTGLVYGRLTVVCRSGNGEPVKWLCKCECGREIVVNGQDIRRGAARKECKECSYASHRSKRPPIIRSGVGVGFFQNGEEFIFSPEDFDFVEKYTWFSDKRGYARTWISRNGDGQKLSLHRSIMSRIIGSEIPAGMEIDHINRNPRDNRRENLRLCSRRENAINRSRINNTSGKIGVQCAQNGRWISFICVYGKKIHLGTFNTYNEAVSARVEAEKKYFGEFAPVYREEVANVETEN